MRETFGIIKYSCKLKKMYSRNLIRKLSFLKLISRTYCVEIGQRATLTRTLTEKDVNEFSILSGDTNIIHTGPKGVVHGAFLNCLVSCLIGTELPGLGSMVVSQNIRYPNPCYVGETVTVSVIISGIKSDLIKCRYTVMAQLLEKNSRPVLTGEASIIMQQNQEKRSSKNKLNKDQN